MTQTLPKTLCCPLIIICVLAVISTGAGSIQEVVSVAAVNVFLTARDPDGKYIRDLQPEELNVFEDGVRQQVLSVSSRAMDPSRQMSPSDVPLSVAFALDISASMSSSRNGVQRIDMAKEADLMLMDELKEGDRIMLATFDRFPRLVTEMIPDRQKVRDLLLIQKPVQMGTALFDSLSHIIDQFSAHSGRKILVLCSDGQDTSSRSSLPELLEQLASTDIQVLAFSIPSDHASQGRFNIQKMAEISGGHAFFPTSSEELAEIVDRLRSTMRNQYSIWYRPSNPAKDGTWRSIRIDCSRQGLELRHRPGYYAK